MSELRDLTVYIGRFSPFHIGHAETISRALSLSKKVLVIVGSAFKARDIKNPWKFEERKRMIMDWVKTTGHDPSKLVVVGQRDYPYNNNRWLGDIQRHVSEHDSGGTVYLTGSDRDDSTFYLKEFPSFKLDLVGAIDIGISQYLAATSIRDLYLSNMLNKRHMTDMEVDSVNINFLPTTSLKFLQEFRQTEWFKTLVEEFEFQVDHDKRWAGAPYTPIFQTVDAVVVQTGHLLLVRRRNAPGRGLWALPGGYLNPNEWMIDGAIRELYEETRLDVPRPVVAGSVKDDHIFEAPGRSNRGRIITRAFLFQLPDFLVNNRVTLPKVKGKDDAEKAKWFTLAEVEAMSEHLFEDHFDIIQTMIARLRESKR